MEVSVLNIKGQETGRKVTLNEAIFGIEPNDHVIYLDVKQFLANQRQGTAKSKERSELSGSTRKLGRQKGGGGARHGDINSPLLRGGARVFGPTPRDYSFKLNKKVKQLARKSALAYKAQENAIVVVEDFTMEAPKTKEFVAIAKNLKVDGKKTLFVLSGKNNNVYLSARNLQGTEVMEASLVNTYKVLNADVLVISEKSKETRDMAFIIKPLVTEKMTKITDKSSVEKTYKVKGEERTKKAETKYGFIVKPEANKLEIKKEIESLYNVTVLDVNTCRYAGKRSSRYTKAGLIKGQKNAFKKAIVTLKEGDTIDFYSNIQ